MRHQSCPSAARTWRSRPALARGGRGREGGKKKGGGGREGEDATPSSRRRRCISTPALSLFAPPLLLLLLPPSFARSDPLTPLTKPNPTSNKPKQNPNRPKNKQTNANSASRPSRGSAVRPIASSGKTDITKVGLNSIENDVVKSNLMGKSRVMGKKGWVDPQGRKGKGYGVYKVRFFFLACFCVRRRRR